MNLNDIITRKPPNPLVLIYHRGNLMHIVFLAFIHETHPQIISKIAQQVRAMRIHNQHTIGLVIGRGLNKFTDRWPELILSDSLEYGAFPNPLDFSKMQFSMARTVIRALNADIVYLRYPDVDEYCLQFCQEFPVVLEHQTIELKQYKITHPPEWITRNEVDLGPRVRGACLGLVSVTREINAFQMAYAIPTVPGHVMANGIDPEMLPVSPRMTTDSMIHILVSAHFRPWHGYERLILGLQVSPAPLVFHFVGEGPILSFYQDAVRKLGLDSHFRFYGHRDTTFTNGLAENCHLGMGSFGHHRMGMLEKCALKVREYCARGLPFVFAGEDTDFGPEFDFVLVVPADDSPILGKDLADFGNRTLSDPRIGQRMRTYLDTRVSWERKMAGLLVFFQEILSNTANKRSILTNSQI